MINWIRSFKWIIQLYNLFKRKELLHNVPLYKKYGIKKKYYSCVSSEDFKHLDNPKPHLDRLDSAQELPKMEAFNALDKISDSNQSESDLLHVRQLIDMVVMLKDKTAGNLSDELNQIQTMMLSELESKYKQKFKTSKNNESAE